MGFAGVPLARTDGGYDRDRARALTSRAAGAGPLTRSRPVAERGLYQRQRRDASCVRPQDPRPQAQPQRMGLAEQALALLLGKAALGADQHVDAAATGPGSFQRGEGIGDPGGLVAEHQQPLRVALT